MYLFRWEQLVLAVAVGQMFRELMILTKLCSSMLTSNFMLQKIWRVISKFVACDYCALADTPPPSPLPPPLNGRLWAQSTAVSLRHHVNLQACMQRSEHQRHGCKSLRLWRLHVSMFSSKSFAERLTCCKLQGF